MSWVSIRLGACLGALALVVSGCMSQEERAALLNGPYPVQVDYSRSIEDSLSAGKYDRVSSQVTSANFHDSETGTGRISAVLVPFSPQASPDYVFHTLVPAGMRPATAKELLAFGEAYPDVQKRFPVMALGSSAELMVTLYHYESRPSMVMPVFTGVEHKLKREYVILGNDLLGRTASVEWLGDSEVYPMFYACFVRQQEPQADPPAQ